MVESDEEEEETPPQARAYTYSNQNTVEDFLEKVSRFYDSVFRVFRNTSSK